MTATATNTVGTVLAVTVAVAIGLALRRARQNNRRMPDSTAIAIVSIGAVATAPLLSSWLEGKREARRFDRELGRQEILEFRSMLDDAAVALGEWYAARAKLTRIWMRQPLAECKEPLDDAQRRRDAALLVHARLRTRLVGQHHPVTKAYDDAMDHMDAAIEPLVDAYVQADMAGTLHLRPAEPVRRKTAEAAKKSIDDFNEAYSRFADEAQKSAGFNPALPQPTP